MRLRGSTARSVGRCAASIFGMKSPRASAHARRCASTSVADHSPRIRTLRSAPGEAAAVDAAATVGDAAAAFAEQPEIDLLARVARGQLAPFRSKATIQARAALPRLTEDRGDLNERQRK